MAEFVTGLKMFGLSRKLHGTCLDMDCQTYKIRDLVQKYTTSL